MPLPDHDVVIVSDLHLSAGYDERRGAFHRNEDFFYDAAFARFLEHLRERAEREGRRWRLVILGDLVDFLQVELPRQRDLLDTSERITLAKLDWIAAGHRPFFAALGRFVAAGFPLDVLSGNHDVEMIRPSAQVRFRELLVEASGQPAAANGVTFYPWIYYVPGLLYGEHGHQYDEVNSFRTQLRPFIPERPERVDAPLGSYFVAYLFNRIETIDPFADNVKPPTAYLGWALRAHPIRALATLGYHFALLFHVLGGSRHSSRLQVESERRAYRDDVVRPHAAEFGLPEEVLVAIDRLAAVPAMTNQRRQLRAMVVGPLLRVLPPLAVLIAATQLVARLRDGWRSLATVALAMLGLVWRERAELRPATAPGGYLLRAAGRIDRILRRAGADVPFYVFGHTHHPEQSPLSHDRRPHRYINSGTWTPTVLADFDLLANRETFTFVEVLRVGPEGAPAARLMVWNDNAGRADLLPLLVD